MLQHTKVSQIGNSLGVILSKEVLAKLRVGKGDALVITETPDGITLRAHDPEFVKQMELAELVMREDRDVLRQFAQ